MPEPKYHHRIPQTYMKEWCNSGNTVWYYDKSIQRSEQRNISKIMGINFFHSIKAGSIFTTPEALNKIFAPINGYKVYEIDSMGVKRELSKELMNRKFSDYDNWIIKDTNGLDITPKKRRIIYSEIKQISDNSIEEMWSQVCENSWKDMILMIEKNVNNIHEKKQGVLTDGDFRNIVKYFVILQWRSYKCYPIVREEFDRIADVLPNVMEMEIEESIHREDKTVRDELWHNFLLSQYYKYFNGEGAMFTQLESFFANLTPLFQIDKKERLITSDNPCFTFRNKDGYIEPVFVALPGLLISLAKKNPDAIGEYRIYEMNSTDVEYYNRVIFENGDRIISKKELDIENFMK